MFFLDYFASSHISAAHVADVVSGMAEACAANGCVLLGGETAEMPGVYRDGHFDVAGTMVGVAERSRLLPRSDIGPGDVLIGIASSGLHTNGYSLARRVFAGLPLDVVPEGMDVTLGEALLAPHRSYLSILRPLLDTDVVKGLVHVTGGGFTENIPRVLPEHCGARVIRGSWRVPPLFALLASASGLDDCELHRTFNMGIGMIVVTAASDVAQVRSMIPEETWEIGVVTAGPRRVELT
jgi:phosphoribosylaminoimidazole synthetase